MVLTHQQISEIKPLNNHVLIKLNRKNDELILEGGTKLYISTTYEEEQHAPVTGHIVAYPRTLFYSHKPGVPHSMPWETELEIQKDDYVIFYYMAVINCMGTLDQPAGNGKYFKDEDGGEYIMITYDNIFVIRRGERIIPVNGWLIIEPIENEDYLREKKKFASINMTLPKNYTKMFANEGIIRFLGKPNKAYRDRDKHGNLRFTDDGLDLKYGMKVMIRKAADIPLEYEYLASLEGRKKFLRVQRKNILYVK